MDGKIGGAFRLLDGTGLELRPGRFDANPPSKVVDRAHSRHGRVLIDRFSVTGLKDRHMGFEPGVLIFAKLWLMTSSRWFCACAPAAERYIP